MVTRSNKPRLIAFYLPQYHPIPENDEWWGKGFTEWTNVTKAKPLFKGHNQPHLPADLGFYDLRVPEVRQAQADLASEYGISGFCYYHYWFNGIQLLNRPFDEVFSSGKPDFPFCLCWANENWTRRWDGKQDQILIQQNYSTDDDLNHIRNLIPIFSDPRYIKINNKPMLLIYRADNLPNPRSTAYLWRKETKRAGFPDLYLGFVVSHKKLYVDPQILGFDAAILFPPNGHPPAHRIKPKFSKIFRIFFRNWQNPFTSHMIFSYEEYVKEMINLPQPNFKLFPGLMPGWDNTPRRKSDGTIFLGATPELYGKWLENALRRSVETFQTYERLIFINAWNEWAEGTHLEPDQQYGHAYLQETYKVLNKYI
jgi:lipopolysaccharide biosynthesis protein